MNWLAAISMVLGVVCVILLFGTFALYLVGMNHQFKEIDKLCEPDKRTKQFREWIKTPDGMRYNRRVWIAIGLAVSVPIWVPVSIFGFVWLIK